MQDASGPPPFPLRVPLDIIAGDGATPRKPAHLQTEPTAGLAKPFLMVWFKCAAKYQKVFRSADGSHYQARCPLCGKAMRFAVGAEGENRRQFEVSC
jgi:hypothetical protein